MVYLKKKHQIHYLTNMIHSTPICLLQSNKINATIQMICYNFTIYLFSCNHIGYITIICCNTVTIMN